MPNAPQNVGLPQFERLAAALVEAETRLACVRSGSADAERVRRCDDLIERARAAIRSGTFWRPTPREFFAWDCLAQFDRQMVHLVDKGELHSIWASVQAEVEEKVGGHRKKAVAKIAAEQTDPKAPDPFAVEAALKHLQTHSQNQYYRIGQLRLQIEYVGFFLLLLIVCVVVAALFKFFDGAAGAPGLSQQVLIGTLLGLAGGLLSVAYTVSRTDETAKIPKLRSSFEVMLARPLIGGALALPVAALVASGAITIGGVDKTWLVAVACFLTGFSERWFLGFVQGLEKKGSYESSAKASDGKH